ncbi:hypothetical protein JR064_00065 [Xanthomonas sp. CFBP 8703]|uniref:Carrier domain-containing protein n=1 Tax=Xanthomonas bonasiae TaxID=2810351 RepID=A0ABS3AWX4_9XANT|nr:phosphopantetheine-binding protein [Xanthomonas bonasiae]MBN6100562.1 hypothetical protein [Xanthomonas bonasiae]MBN6111415.1 hypothetical protein [Xanthomonas bonasiae]
MQAHDMKWMEQEIKKLIVSELGLEDIAPEEIDSDMSLFGGGLGLSSVNALELDAALKKRFVGSGVAEGDVRRLGAIDLFRYSTVRLLAEYLGQALAPSDRDQAQADFGARRRIALEQKNKIRNG